MIKKYLKHITYCVSFLLLFNAGLSAVPVHSMEDSVNGQRILLCTTQGYQWVYVDELSSILEGSSEFSKLADAGSVSLHLDCPFCALSFYSIDGAVNNPLLSTVFSLRFSIIARHYLTDDRVLDFSPSFYSLSRAPPAFI